MSVKDESFNMTRAWDKEDILVPDWYRTHDLPNTWRCVLIHLCWFVQGKPFSNNYINLSSCKVWNWISIIGRFEMHIGNSNRTSANNVKIKRIKDRKPISSCWKIITGKKTFCTFSIVYVSQQQPSLTTLTVKNATSSSPKILFLDNTFLGANLMVDITGVSVMVLSVSVLISTVERSGIHAFTAVMERQNVLKMVGNLFHNFYFDL